MNGSDNGVLRIITIARYWQPGVMDREPDPAWRFLETQVLPAHPDAQVTCLTRFRPRSGANPRVLFELAALLGSNQWDLVVVDAVETLAYNTDVATRLIRQMHECGVRFVAVEDGLDTGPL